MRAVAWTLSPSAVRALRSLSLAARRRPSLAPPASIVGGAADGFMGQALSLLPLPGRGQRREVAAAAKARPSMDRPAEEDPDLWWELQGARTDLSPHHSAMSLQPAAAWVVPRSAPTML